MRNVEAEIDGQWLTMRVNLAEEEELSGSGKSMVIASSEGNQSVGEYQGRTIKVGVNVYYPATQVKRR